MFDALTTTSGLAAWWAPVTGTAADGGDLCFTFERDDVTLVVHVDTALPPSVVIWQVKSCTVLPEWVGTTPSFTLTRCDDGGCDLRFEHHGLRPTLSCYRECRAGWDQYLANLRDHAESHPGRPLRRNPVEATASD